MSQVAGGALTPPNRSDPFLGRHGAAATGLGGAAAATGAQAAGSEPIQVVMQEPGVRAQLWRAVRTLAVAFLVISGINTLLEDRGLPKGALVQKAQPPLRVFPAADAPPGVTDGAGRRARDEHVH